MSDELKWLQEWYATRCDSDWEHSYGVRIETLDNPGWTIEIDLTGTKLDQVTVPKKSIERSEHDWISYEVADRKFCAHGGPSSLAELITAFRRIWEDQR